MSYIPLDDATAAIALELFNNAASVDMVHKRLTLQQFIDKFLKPSIALQQNIGIVAQDGTAFAAGCYVNTEPPKAYITMVVVDKSARRKGVGSNILRELEQQLLLKSNAASVDLSFFNPQNLEWIVPDTNGHDHPNTPGVDVQSQGYMFFKNCGYRDAAYQNSYYIPLSNYSYPADIQNRKAFLKENNVEICLYNKDLHTGLDVLIDSFDSDLWRRDILGEMDKDKPRPLLIAVKDGKAQGFTGPLDVQLSGRGYFAGIGVHESCRGVGAAKVLFSQLCMSLKDMGADFMTLFTGETNPARNIYEAAGFKIVHTWAVMRKENKKKESHNG